MTFRYDLWYSDDVLIDELSQRTHFDTHIEETHYIRGGGTGMINVLLVEDSKIARDMMVNNIAKSEDYELVATLENAANAEIVCAGKKVDLILMDVCTADDESGLEAAAKIKKYRHKKN